MPLWSDPTFGEGILPAQAPFPGPAAVDPKLVASIAATRMHQQQQAQQGIQQAISAFGQFMENRQRDQIANSLLAQQQAVKASPVTPDTLYGEPSAALSPEEAAQNKALGFGTTPGRAPDLGGVAAYQAQVLAAQNQAKLDAVNALTASRTALAQERTAGPAATEVSSRQYYNIPDPNNPGQTIRVTGNAYANFAKQGKAAADPLVKMTGQFGLKPDDLTNIDNIDATQSQIIPPKGNAGQKMQFVLKDGRQATIPWDKWQSMSSLAKLRGEGGGAAPGASIPQISSPDEARKLPSGSLFIDPNGITRTVP